MKQVNLVVAHRPNRWLYKRLGIKLPRLKVRYGKRTYYAGEVLTTAKGESKAQVNYLLKFCFPDTEQDTNYLVKIGLLRR